MNSPRGTGLLTAFKVSYGFCLYTEHHYGVYVSIYSNIVSFLHNHVLKRHRVWFVHVLL
jgi:hypothetical protein